MHRSRYVPIYIFQRRYFADLLVLTLFLLLLTACDQSSEITNDAGLAKTQAAINEQLTSIAARITPTLEPQVKQSQVAQSVQATIQFKNDVQATVDAVQAASSSESTTMPSPPTLVPPTTVNPTVAVTQVNIDQAGFEQWMKSASILLYEDIAARRDTTRYVLEALEDMGLKPTVDDKDAGGNFLTDLRAGASGGKVWDLIISASENRTDIQGEFIAVLNDNVKAGSALIFEHWNIGKIAQGKIDALLHGCGVEYEADLTAPHSTCALPANENFLILWPQEMGNPILHQPNENIRISSMSQYWSKVYKDSCSEGYRSGPDDYGDLLGPLPGSKARLVLGAFSTIPDRHSVLVSCHEGRVILWTSSTHNYDHKRISPLWVNMIYNALKGRYEYLNHPQ